jgi:hypothetical protein
VYKEYLNAINIKEIHFFNTAFHPQFSQTLPSFGSMKKQFDNDRIMIHDESFGNMAEGYFSPEDEDEPNH